MAGTVPELFTVNVRCLRSGPLSGIIATSGFHSRPWPMDFSPEQIRQQLAAVLASERFLASARSRRLLEFLVEETLAGRGDRLKGFYVACEFLGRGADFDPLIDPIVRIEVGKLRRALEQYYLACGEAAAIRIEIPRGNYQPLFVAVPATAPADRAPLLGRASLVIRCAAADATNPAGEFAAGLAQQLAAQLDRLGDALVLGAEEVSRARFVLDVGVRSSGQRLRVSARLEDRARGQQVWADTWTEERIDAFALEDELARTIVNRIADPNTGEMFKALALSAREDSRPSPDEIVARFNTDHMQRLDDPLWLGEATRCLRELIAERPDFGAAHAALSKALHDAWMLGEVDQPAMREALEHARLALRLEPDSQHALAALANACIALGERERAIQAIERSLALNRSGHSARAIAAAKLIMLGEAERAEALLAEHQREQGGEPAAMTVVGLALLAWLRGEHEAALAAVSRNLFANSFWGALVRTVALAETGDLDGARAALDRLKAENPVFARDPRRFLATSLYRRDWQQKLLAALGRAGLEDGPG